MTIPKYTPAGCAPITLITQAFSHFNYSLSSGPTIHCTIFIIYVVYNVFYLSILLHCDVIRNFKEHTNALTVIYLLIYLVAFHTSNISSNMYNALFYILYLVMYFIDSILIFILPTKYLCYLSLRLLSNICTFSCLVFLFFVT